MVVSFKAAFFARERKADTMTICMQSFAELANTTCRFANAVREKNRQLPLAILFHTFIHFYLPGCKKRTEDVAT